MVAISSSSSCGGSVWVRLQPYFQVDYTVGTSTGFRIRIVAEDACGMDCEIFRYYQKPLNLQGELESVFSGVCTWPEMIELPITEPAADSSPAGFRLNYIDLVVDSESIANAIWDLIKIQAKELAQTIKDGETLQTTAAYTASAT